MKHLRPTKIKGSFQALISFVCLGLCIAVVELFLGFLFYQWFPILCSQNWIFKVILFIFYYGNSDRDFASSIMILVSHKIGLNSNQPTFGQIYFRVKRLMEGKKTVYKLIFMGFD